MRCPYCGNPDTRVIDSRPAEDKNSIRRRRSCDECGRRFTTYEKAEQLMGAVLYCIREAEKLLPDMPAS